MTAAGPKLAYVAHTLNPGGTEKLVVEMSLAFAEDYGVEVICLDEPGAWAADLRRRGVPVHCLWRQPGLDLTIVAKLARLLERMRADVVHAHQCTPWFYAALSRLLYRSPRLLLEEHGRFYPEADNPRKRFVNRHVVRRLTHAFVAVSEDVRARLERYEGLDARRIDVVYNGVRPPERLTADERTSMRRSLGFDDGDFVVGTVGRFDPIKNLPMLVASLARARADVPALKGLLVGDGPERGRVAGLVGAAGLDGAVRLTGFREDARRLAQCMDLFVLASFSEGTSMALLEAMSAGTAVAVTDVGGNPEVVETGRTGWVVPSDAVDALTRAIVEAATDSGERQRRAAAGVRRFEQTFSFDGMLEHYRRIYAELAGGRARAAAGPKPGRARDETRSFG